jgi:hypothetical protein
MSDNNTTDVEQNNETPERTNTTEDHNKDFLAIIVIILLAIIWMVTNSTVLICTMMMIFMAKSVQLFNLNATTNDNAIIISPPTQVCAKCSSTMAGETFSDRIRYSDDSTTSNARGQLSFSPFF